MSWITNNMQPGGPGLWQSNDAAALESFAPGGYGAPASGLGPSDGYRPAWWGGNQQPYGGSDSPGAWASPETAASAASYGGVLGQIMGLLQQLVSGFGFGSPSGYGSGPAQSGGPQPGIGWGGMTFQNATLSSTGDPHLAVTGTADLPGGGTTSVNDHYDDMGSHRDLLSTDDFGDRFRVSTTASTPNANGVTYNQSATATMEHGLDRVTMGPGGAISVVDDGHTESISAGQTLTLSGGETVTEAANGSVSIGEQNANGESLVTTFTDNGPGVDVSATASGGVTLGGDLVRHAATAV